MSANDNVHVLPVKRPTVLLITADQSTRSLGVDSLTEAGFAALEASSGSQALDQVKKHAPDIVVIGVEVSGMDAYSVCADIRSAKASSATPILMLTDLDDAESLNLAYQAGATDFAIKPVNWLLLCHRLRYVLRSNQAIVELEQSRTSLAASQRISRLGSWVLSIDSGKSQWSEQLYSILGTDRQSTPPDFSQILKCVHQDDRARVLNHRAETKIHELAYYDGLTRLPNRSLFAERLDLALELARRYKRKLAVMFIDMDDFKRVNDTLGHSSGDLLLRTVANRLQSCVRSSDLLHLRDGGSGGETVARMGGDEFTILLPEIKKLDEAIAVAQRILDSLSQPYDLSGNEVYSTPSVGIALFPEDSDSAGELIKNADIAMYFAKREGKNIYKVNR